MLGEDDQDWERDEEGKYFLSGCGDGSPDDGPLVDIVPVRHGVTETWSFNTMDAGGDSALPFHPVCFKSSRLFRKVDWARWMFMAFGLGERLKGVMMI